MLKVIFFHNTLAEYRVGFFKALAEICDLNIVFTDYFQGERIYKNKLSANRINKNYVILRGSKSERIRQAVSLLKKSEYDWIILPTLDDIYSIFLSCKLLRYAKEIKVGYFWEKWESDKKKQPFDRRVKEYALRLIIRPLMKKMNIIFYPGTKTLEYIQSFNFKNVIMQRIHDSSQIEENETIKIREKYAIQKDINIILFLGRVVKIKGADILINAFAECNEDFQNKNILVIAGDGEELEYCKNIVQSKGINNVLFTGRVNPEDRYSFFKEAQVFVLPDRILKGRVDAWGLTINEALQCGCVVIASTGAGATFDLVSESNGIIVEEGNQEELVKALQNSVSKKLIESANEAKKSFVMEYNYFSMAKDFITAMERY